MQTARLTLSSPEAHYFLRELYINRDDGQEKSVRKRDNNPFHRWNNRNIQPVHNCYTFACNALKPDLSHYPEGRYCVAVPCPGGTGKAPVYSMGYTDMRRALEADGLVPVPGARQEDIRVPKGHYLVASYIHFLNDCHFYRRHEKSGLWYHKQSWGGRVTPLDGSFRSIWDPQRADRGAYNTFIGFYLVPNRGIKLDIRVEPIDEKGHVISGAGNPEVRRKRNAPALTL